MSGISFTARRQTIRDFVVTVPPLISTNLPKSSTNREVAKVSYAGRRRVHDGAHAPLGLTESGTAG
jgi:hypothetical protein